MQVERRQVLIGDISIAFHDTGGDKPVMVCCHGITDSGRCWDTVADPFHEQYRLILPDARGHGDSDKPVPDGSDPMPGDLIGLLEHLDCGPVLLVGHSMGGRVAAHVAMRRPDLVTKLVLEDPPWYASRSPAQISERMDGFREFIRTFSHMDRQSIIDAGKTFNPGWDEREIIPWAEAKLAIDENVVDYLIAEDWRKVARRIVCPTLLLTADNERGAIVTPQVADQFDMMGMHTHHVHVRGAGHSIRRDQFVGFMRALTGFL